MTMLIYFVSLLCILRLHCVSSICLNYFVDLGSNIGIQCRKLFEPSLFPDAPLLPLFDKWFGPPLQRRQHTCSIGFEANPTHTARLRMLASHLARLGANATFHTAVVAGTVDRDNVTFFIDPDAAHQSWGSSVLGRKTFAEHALVHERDIRPLMRSLKQGNAQGKVVVKMDVEGYEYVLMPALLRAGLLCADVIDVITLNGTRKRLYKSKALRNFSAVLQRSCARSRVVRPRSWISTTRRIWLIHIRYSSTKKQSCS